MADNRTRRRNQRQARRVIQNMTEAVESGNLERQRRIQQEGGNFMRDFYMRYVGPSGANSNSNLRDFYMQRYTGSNSNSNRTRRVRSRSPSNSNRTRLAPSRRRSSAAPGRLIGSRTPSSPPGAPLRGRPRSRSSPSSSSRSSSSSSRGSNSNSNYSISTPYYYQWKVVKLNNPPKEDIALNNFNNKDAKAVKVSWTLKGKKKKYSDYYTPRTVTGLMYTFEGKPKPGEITNRKIQSAMQRLKSSSTDPNKVVFEHPGTRANVRRKNLEFVRLEKRTNKNKAATKIQAAFRGGRERQKTLNKAKRTAALITKKRRRN